MLSWMCLSAAYGLWWLRPDRNLVLYRVRINNRQADLRLRRACRWVNRQVGLLNHQSLGLTEGVHLVPSKQIHTRGMLFAIDVVFLDQYGRVLEVIEAVSPGQTKIRGPLGTYSCVELKAGSVKAFWKIRIGDRLEFDVASESELESVDVRPQNRDQFSCFFG